MLMHVRWGITVSPVGVAMDNIVSGPPDAHHGSLHDVRPPQCSTQNQNRKSLKMSCFIAGVHKTTVLGGTPNGSFHYF